VRVARMGVPAQPAPLATPLLADGGDLAVRVDRLLHPSSPPASPRALSISGAACALALTALALQPATLRATHRLLEILVH
jgi:hypothetical protein